MIFDARRDCYMRAVIIALTTICLSGCGDSPPAKESIANVAEVPPILITDDKSTADNPTTANDQSRATDNPPNEKVEDTAAPVVPPVIAARSVPVPTTEQLARWKQPEFEPLQLLARHGTKETSFVSQTVHSNNGDWLVLGGEKLTLWKPLAEEPLAILWDLKGNEEAESIKSLAIDPTGRWIAVGDAKGTLRLWSLNDQKDRGNKKVQGNAIAQIAIADDGLEIATASYGKSVSIWHTKTLELKKKFDVNTRIGDTIAYAGPAKLAVASESLTIWDTTTGTLAKTLLEDGYVASFTRSNDRSLFGFAEENQLRFMKSTDLTSSSELLGNFARNEILKLSPDGKFLWTANATTVRGWDLTSGQVVQTIDVNKPQVVGLDWLDKLKLLRVVTDDGTICYWGTVADGLAVGLKPIHAPIEIPNEHAAPATAFELQAMLDLRTIPKPPESVSLSGELAMNQIDSGNSIDDTKAFYRHVFEQRGWKETPGNAATPDYLTFGKNGFRIFISISDSGSGRNTIYLTTLGNVDLRTLPKLELPAFKLSYESDSNVSYEVGADLLTIETELLKKFSASGWIPYARLNSSHNVDPSSRSLEFVQNAITIRVSVQPKQDTPSTYSVQYTAFVAPNHLPFPKDCDFIECDVARSPALVVKTSLSLEDCHAFYDQAMSKLGWLSAGVVKSKEDDLRWLTYFRNQIEASIQLIPAKEGGTWVVAGEYAKENSWQLAKKEEPTQDALKPNHLGIQAADFPIFKTSDATSITYDKLQERIEIKLPKNSHVEIVDFYAAELATLGWKEEPNGFRDEDYAFVTFKKDDATVEVRVNSNSLGTTIGISDEGLLWDKALPEAKTVISYESWMRKNGFTASLKMLDQYVQEMRKLLDQ
jgi:WD40 repeat protein